MNKKIISLQTKNTEIRNDVRDNKEIDVNPYHEKNSVDSKQRVAIWFNSLTSEGITDTNECFYKVIEDFPIYQLAPRLIIDHNLKPLFKNIKEEMLFNIFKSITVDKWNETLNPSLS
ncbi:MAG: hypothetical protein GY730_12045 [bacterium]|nr:hypothetical protein [bacterium]